MKITALAGIAALSLGALAATGSAYAAEPIAGKWKRSNGTIIQYSGSGMRYCAKVVNGKYAGQSIGCMSGKGKSYKGKVKVLDEGKTYSGSAKVNGNSMKLTGCIVWPACKSETLRRVK